MRRTSARLRSAGYYDTHKEYDASVKYIPNPNPNCENAVKLFKKRSAAETISFMPPIPARYLMSEGLSSRLPIDNKTSTTSSTRTTYTYRVTNGPSKKDSVRGYMRAISSAFSMTSLSWTGAEANSRMMHVGDLVSSRMKKTCGLLLLLLVISLCVWLLFPVMTHFVGLKLLPHQPSTHLDVAEENKKLMNLEMQDLIGLISSLRDRIKALEMKNAEGVKPPAPLATNSQLTPAIQQAMEKWLSNHIKEQAVFIPDDKGFGHSIADNMADFALEVQGARVITSRCSETYHVSRAFATLFGFKIWSVTVGPRTAIQGLAPLLPGRCWSFPGAQGTLAITLSNPVKITDVTVDHIARYISPSGSIKSAPKEFELYGMRDISGKRTLLGTFTYDQSGESTQTFQLPNPTDDIYRGVEMHVLSNWGQAEYTCLYRFRVHGKIAST
ncbi:unnamed protein product [Pleuronectes platessa]|uniref:SUN domain-containing protein n=1 Tax=Pleuronectes platessa TaxID=8262 RepID=A0A9N7VMS4_PLEPL|nr:unnamed protein product [Pleuronectes platessa]